MTTTPDWVAPGSKVAIYDYRTAVIATVERHTATQIVCTGRRDERRFRKDGLREVGQSYGPELRPLNDPQVVDMLAQQRISALRYKVDGLCRDAGNDVESIRATLDQIAEAVAAARRAITDGADR